jgi:acetyl esterase/lipase
VFTVAGVLSDTPHGYYFVGIRRAARWARLAGLGGVRKAMVSMAAGRVRMLRLATVLTAVLAVCAAGGLWSAGSAGAAAQGRAAVRATGCPKQPAGVTIHCGIIYYGLGTSNQQTLDVYEPTNQLTTPLPAVLLIHGGGWRVGGSQGGDLPYVAEQLAKAGLPTFSLNYTLDTKGPTFPLALNEIYGAVTFLDKNPSRTGYWDIDPNHIGALGESAGANFAGMLATCADQGAQCPVPQIQAASIWSAPFDLTPLGCAKNQCKAGQGGVTLDQYLGCYLDKTQMSPCNPMTPKLDPAQAYAAASPANWVTKAAAPMQIWNSDNELIPISQVSDMVGKESAACAGYRFAALPGNQHTTYTGIVLNATIAFLQQQLGPNPPALGCTTAPPLTDTAMAYDQAANQVVAFGGCCNPDGSLLNDTWTLSNGTWTLQSPKHSPPARIGASMAYDQSTNQVILFGGETDAATDPSVYNTMLNDTWSWNGSDWTQRTSPTSPLPRSEASMAYDSTTGDVVLYGGEAAPTMFNNAASLGDTWDWTGTGWTEAATTGPPKVYGAAMATDAGTGHPVLFDGNENCNCGGGCDDNCFNLSTQTWEWTGSAWQQLFPAQVPQAREFASMATTPSGLVMYGGLNGVSHGTGHNVTDVDTLEGDTWVWSNGQWAKQTPGASPPVLYDAAAASGPTGSQAILVGGLSTGQDAYSPNTYLWTGSTWTAGPPLTR